MLRTLKHWRRCCESDSERIDMMQSQLSWSKGAVELTFELHARWDDSSARSFGDGQVLALRHGPLVAIGHACSTRQELNSHHMQLQELRRAVLQESDCEGQRNKDALAKLYCTLELSQSTTVTPTSCPHTWLPPIFAAWQVVAKNNRTFMVMLEQVFCREVTADGSGKSDCWCEV